MTSSKLNSQYAMRLRNKEPSWASNWQRVCAEPKLDTILREDLGGRISRILMAGDNIQALAGPATPPITPPQTNENEQAPSGDGPRERRANFPLRYRENQVATPGPSTRERPATTSVTSDLPLVLDEDDDDETYEPGPKRAKRTRSPIVVLPTTPPRSNVTTPKTSSSKGGKSLKTRHRTGGRPGAIHPFPRPNGSTIMLFEHEWIEAQQDLQIISEAAAHPKTGPSLVFRYWDDKSHGL